MTVLQPGPDGFIARRRRRQQERRDRRADRQRQGRGQPGSRANQPKFQGLRANPFIGSLLPLNEAGKYVCPPLVVAGRAAVSPSEYWRLQKQTLEVTSMPCWLMSSGKQGGILTGGCQGRRGRANTELEYNTWEVVPQDANAQLPLLFTTNPQAARVVLLQESNTSGWPV